MSGQYGKALPANNSHASAAAFCNFLQHCHSKPAFKSTSQPGSQGASQPERRAAVAHVPTCANCSTTLFTKLPIMSSTRAPQGLGRAASSAARTLDQLLKVASAFS